MASLRPPLVGLGNAMAVVLTLPVACISCAGVACRQIQLLGVRPSHEQGHRWGSAGAAGSAASGAASSASKQFSIGVAQRNPALGWVQQGVLPAVQQRLAVP